MELGWCYLKETLWSLMILHYLNVTILNCPLKKGILIMSSLMKKRRNQNKNENEENEKNGHDNENPWNSMKKNAKR